MAYHPNALPHELRLYTARTASDSRAHGQTQAGIAREPFEALGDRHSGRSTYFSDHGGLRTVAWSGLAVHYMGTAARPVSHDQSNLAAAPATFLARSGEL